MSYNKIVSLVLFIVLTIACASSITLAASFTLSDDYEALSLSNEYMEIYLGVAGKCTYVNNDSETYVWEVPGRYSVRTRAGDPETTGDDSKDITPWAPYPCGYFGYWKIKVGDQVILVGTGDIGNGSWSTKNPPTSYTQPVEGGSLGPGGPYLEGVWDIAGNAPVGVKVNISLVRDQVRFEMTLTNKATTTQSIGLGMFSIPQVSESGGGGFPFIPGTGLARTTVGTPGSFPGTIFSSTKVPSSFEIYDSIDSPMRVARYTLKEQDCTAPDYVALGEWEDGGILVYGTWLPDGYTPDPQRALNYITCLLQWKQSALAPGASRKYVTYYGIGAASEKWTYKSSNTVVRDSATASVQAPRSLKFDSTDPYTNLLNLTPDPFTISAYVYNTTVDSCMLEGVSAYLYLPEGLELVSTYTARQEVGDVLLGTESDPVTWQVKPTGTCCGELEYYVAFSDKNGWQQTVTRKVFVPAAKKAVYRHGFQMVSVPFTFNNPSIEHAFSNLEAGSYRALEYDVSTNGYLPITQVEPGKGYWMYVYDISNGSSKSYNLAADAAIVGEYYGKQSKEQYIELVPGWNMIGNPFVYPIYVGQIKFLDTTTNSTYTFDEAVKKGWISRTIYGWNHDKYAYESISSNSSLLVPWKGYWIRAKARLKMLLRPAAWPDSNVTSLLGGF